MWVKLSFITTGRKVFDTKHFSSALGISRVSFAPAEMMEEMLGNKIGAATVFGTLLDRDRDVQVIIDKGVADEEFYGCSDGTTTCYIMIYAFSSVLPILMIILEVWLWLDLF